MGYDEPVGVPQRYLAEIIGPRAREMASLIAAEVERAGPLGMFPGGIVITGGGALLRGFAEVVQQQTNLPARVAAPQGLHGMNDEIRGPSHATWSGCCAGSSEQPRPKALPLQRQELGRPRRRGETLEVVS